MKERMSIKLTLSKEIPVSTSISQQEIIHNIYSKRTHDETDGDLETFSLGKVIVFRGLPTVDCRPVFAWQATWTTAAY